MDLEEKPKRVVSFDVRADVVEAVRIVDRWSDIVAPEEFGRAALQVWYEQVQERALGAFDTTTPQAPMPAFALPSSVARDLSARVTDLLDQALAVLDDAKAGTPAATPSEPRTYSDPRRHVVVTAIGGEITGIDVDPHVLRGDIAQIETDMAEALTKALADQGQGLSSRIASLWAEQRDVSRVLTDYSKEIA